MESSFFLKGLILGFSIAAPVGPIGILCIRRTLHFGRLSGFFSGLGAALADSIYGAIAAFGLTLISDFLEAGKFWLHLIGGFFLLFLGAKTFFAKTQEMSHSKVSHKTLFSDFASTFFLTITNPMTIVAFLAVFAGLGLSARRENCWEAVHLISGIFIGSAFWWWLLSEGITFFRRKISQKVMMWVNRLAGFLIFGFGLAALFLAI
ncbi:MAG: LysE family translocator [Parachlamydiales bacterium]|nr:LysE family translocator [Parachlamydiales bacterium]